MLDGRDFDLDGGPSGEQTSRYARELPQHWCFGGRAFGGYTSALALAAVFAHTGRQAAASLSVTFVEQRRARAAGSSWSTPFVAGGPPRRSKPPSARPAGRSSSRAVGSPTAGSSRRPSTPRSRSTATDPVRRRCPIPPIGTTLEWIRDEWPPLRFAYRRGIDYPEGAVKVDSGRPEVALWVKVDDGRAGRDPLTHPQIGDVLHGDAHLFDSPAPITGFVDTWLLSLDLSIVWQPGAHRVAVDPVASVRGPRLGRHQRRHRLRIAARRRRLAARGADLPGPAALTACTSPFIACSPPAATRLSPNASRPSPPRWSTPSSSDCRCAAPAGRPRLRNRQRHARSGRPGARVTAVDITPELVAIGAHEGRGRGPIRHLGHRRCIRHRPARADLRRGGLQHGHHLRRAGRQVAELGRLLKSGGTLGFSSWVHDAGNPFFNPIVAVLGPPPQPGYSPDQWGEPDTHRGAAGGRLRRHRHRTRLAHMAIRVVGRRGALPDARVAACTSTCSTASTRRSASGLWPAFEAAMRAHAGDDGRVSFDSPYVVVTASGR